MSFFLGIAWSVALPWAGLPSVFTTPSPEMLPHCGILQTKAQEPNPTQMEKFLKTEVGFRDFHLVRLGAASEAAPFTVSLPNPFGQQPLEVRLQPHSLRATNFQVLVYEADGGYRQASIPALTTYRGKADGPLPLQVLASRTALGWRMSLKSDLEDTWSVHPVRRWLPTAGQAWHVLVREDLVEEIPFLCGAEASPHSASAPNGSASGMPNPSQGQTHELDKNCQYLGQIAFDADYEYYQLFGSSVPNTVAQIESHMNEVDYFYARDVQITHEITTIIVRTAPFYTPTSGGDLLDQFRIEWINNQSHIQRDMAHLMTNKPGSIIQYGGLAWVGVVCDSNYGYAWSLDSAGIVGHEVGHNWGSGHCHDVSPCNNMCGACLYIGPNTKDIIVNFRNSRNCLEKVGPYPTPVPPYAHPDFVRLNAAQLEREGSLILDILGNDHDGNCQALRLLSFDTTTALGAGLSVSKGTGDQGQDQLIYTPGPVPPLGSDSFEYVVGDDDGLMQTGIVSLEIQDPRLHAYWALDSGQGSTALDATPRQLDGSFVGDPLWISGVSGNALEFDGVDDAVLVSAPFLNTREATISAWVRRDGTQNGRVGLLFSRDQNTTAGLKMTQSGELLYNWNNDSGAFSWRTGLLVPDGVWTFVALVVAPDNASIHMDDGILQTVSQSNIHQLEEFDGELYLGWDSNSPNNYLRGALDDVRLFNFALTAAEVQGLADLEGAAYAPNPVNGDTLLEATTSLAWTSAISALSHDVYLGTDYLAVKNANTGSPEFQANVLTSSFTPSGLLPNRTYFWRIDERNNGGVVTGDVWRFAVSELHHWALDEVSGTVAADSAGTQDGEYLDGPSLNQPGATAQTGTSVRFDGVDDRVRIPPLNFQTDEATFACWALRNGGQFLFTGLVFCRGPNTTAGLNLGTHNELRYHWNGEHFGWDSGLELPNGEWVFTALVVEPQQATIYMGHNGVLSSAVHAVTHGVEEFDANTLVGRDSASPSRSFEGSLDEVRIYNRALTPSQIQALYDSMR